MFVLVARNVRNKSAKELTKMMSDEDIKYEEALMTLQKAWDLVAKAQANLAVARHALDESRARKQIETREQ